MRPRSRRPLAALLVGVLVASGCAQGGRTYTTAEGPLVSTTVAPAEPRDPWLWPFTSDSPWNTPLGSNASYLSVNDPATVNLLDTRIKEWVNSDEFSHPVVRASDTDPKVAVAYAATATAPLGAGSVTINMPASARPAAGVDAHLHIVEPGGTIAHEFFDFRNTATGATATYYVRSDLRGAGILEGGTRAYGGSALGGLIRTWEMEQRSIRHALAIALTGPQLRRGPLWPADEEDAVAPQTYTGQIPIGTLLAIPAGIDVDAMQLTPPAVAVARALQQYGAYVVDTAAVMTLYAEPNAPAADIAAIRDALPRIRRELRIVTNNTPATPGGGGIPLATPAPPLR